MATKNEAKTINYKDVVGGGYDEFWRDKHRYRVLKGGRASKKSTTTALWFIYNIMKYPQANALVDANEVLYEWSYDGGDLS